MESMRSSRAVRRWTTNESTIHLICDQWRVVVFINNGPHRGNDTSVSGGDHCTRQMRSLLGKPIIPLRSLACREECKICMLKRMSDDLGQRQASVVKVEAALIWIGSVLDSVASEVDPTAFSHAFDYTLRRC
jgi:hypothetical protein